MQTDIHPAYHEVTVTCRCGNEFVTRSTLKNDKLSVEICNKCHPFYTGKQKMIDTAGRLQRFKDKYKKKD